MYNCLLRLRAYNRRCWTMYPVSLDFPYVLFEREEINSVLYKPINSTHRIKYTCFHASSSYIVLGSTSGSIYLFSREPCSFLQIIPLSEGIVSRLAISPDEKTVALATTRGTVCLVSLKSTPQLMAVSTEHIYKQITCLCWNNNSTEIYIGDTVGTVSIMSISIFTVNGMFQTPACTLMNLDSSVVQLNFLSPLLLVSTLSRCYICNTAQEQYKQIGNKPRNGEFGACFYTKQIHENTTSDVQREEKNINNTRGTFNLISDNHSNNLGENHSKIFCARPGSRLWEVSTDGVVVKTHQFKEALAVPSTPIFRSDGIPGSSRKTEREWPAQSVNFSHLSVIARKYLFSYTTSGLYVIDPASASVLLWNDEYRNISMTAIANDRIYLMTCDNVIHCLALSSLDCLILRLYRRERYSESLRACFVYKSQLLRAASTKEIVELLEQLETMPRDEESLAFLRPLITLLQTSGGNNRPAKLDSGIVVVHPENDTFADGKRMYGHEVTSRSLETSREDSSETLGATRDPNESLVPEDASETALEDTIYSNYECGTTLSDDNRQKSNSQENVACKVQSDLQLIYNLANSIRPSMPEGEVEEIVMEIDKRIRTVRESYRDASELQNFIYEVTRAAELHCYNTFLGNVSAQLLRATRNDYIVRQFARAFIEVNAPAYARCSCGYPCPMDKAAEPKFLAIGESLIKRLADETPEECGNICDRVPCMWREYLAVCIERRNTLDNLLRQCLQTRDNVVLSLLLPVLTEQQWGCVSMCLNDIADGICLFCATPLTRKPDYNVLVDWSGIAREIMTREGPDQAAAFLNKLESMIPNINLDRRIFQSIVFTKMLCHRGLNKSIDFSKTNQSKFGTVCSAQVREQLAKALEKDLRQPIDKKVFGTRAHHWGMRYQAKSSTCACCTLSLQTPILLGDSGIAIFRCGHAYHVNCMIERKLTRCNLHQ